jgi:hypothetical protein
MFSHLIRICSSLFLISDQIRFSINGTELTPFLNNTRVPLFQGTVITAECDHFRPHQK